MGIDFVAKNADFSANAIGYEPPVTRGVQYWGFIGGGAGVTDAAKLARVRKNWISGKADGGIVGAPVPAVDYTSKFKTATNYIDTGVAETDAMTLLLGFRVPGATASNPTTDLATNGTRPMMMGNMGTGGVGLYISGTTGLPSGVLSGAANYDNSGTPAVQIGTLTIPDVTAWRMASLTVTPGTGFRLRGLTSGISAYKADTRTRSKNTATSTIRIGSTGRNDFLGEHDICFAAVYTVALTDAEIDSIYAAVKSFLAPRGIAI